MPSEIGLALAPDLNPAPDPDPDPGPDLDQGPAQEVETKKTRTQNPEADPRANRKKGENDGCILSVGHVIYLVV